MLEVGALTGTVGKIPCVSIGIVKETISLAVELTGVLSLVELELVFRLIDGGLGRLTGNLNLVSV